MVNRLLLFLLFSTCCNIYAQTTDCIVKKLSISGVYTGDCKKGLAHGMGTAQGIDRYEGHFIKGLPDGKGTYRWTNGIYYEGEWKEGLREGKGKMVYPDSVVAGIWKGDNYMGKMIIPPYQIVTSMSVSRSTITKSQDKNYSVRIRVKQGGIDNIAIEGFTMVYDSGTEYRSGNFYGLEGVRFPLGVKVKYRSWNQLMTSQYNVIFEFIINEPGSWDVVIIN